MKAKIEDTHKSALTTLFSTFNKKNHVASVYRCCFLLLLFAVTFSPSQAAWRKQDLGTLAWLHSIYFLNDSRGFIVGANGTLFSTINGGVTWEKAVKLTEDNIRDVVFTDEQSGWLLCERDVIKARAGDARSYLLRTFDGGVTWQKSNFPLNSTASLLTKFVVSPDKSAVWAIGEVGTLYLLTTGDGARWQKQASPTKYLLTGGTWLNNNQSWLVGAGGTLLTTIDNGKAWREISLLNFNSPNEDKLKLNAAVFPNSKSGWIVGTGGKILTTDDGGRKWRIQNSGTKADLLDAQFLNELTGWIAGDGGTLLSTQNGGATWQQENISNSPHRLERIFFTNDERGWAIGFGGTLFVHSK